MIIHRSGDGYWIAPTGHVLRSASRHITAVCQRPEAFGICKQELEALFASRAEGWATEQSAREIVIKALVNQAGWIRVRHYHRRHAYWEFNLPSLDAAQRARIGAFFKLLGHTVSPYDEVLLDAPGVRQERTSVEVCLEQRGQETVALIAALDVNSMPVSSEAVHLDSL